MEILNLKGIQENVPLAKYTTFKIGGPAKYFITVDSKDEMHEAILAAREAGIEIFILGGGSDILVSDKGFDGLVIKMEIRDVDVNEAALRIRAGAGLLMSGLIRLAAKHNMQGIEYAAGVPATVGGAVWANLGARGSDISEWLLEVSVFDQEMNYSQRSMTVEECTFGYRDSIFKQKPGLIITDALFQFKPGDKTELLARIKELTALRNETQDITAQCAGCVFRNPTDQTDEPAAKIIDELGLKGHRIGGAVLSETHANFVLNTEDATAQDVVDLIAYIKEVVKKEKGIDLEEEVEYVGF